MMLTKSRPRAHDWYKSDKSEPETYRDLSSYDLPSYARRYPSEKRPYLRVEWTDILPEARIKSPLSLRTSSRKSASYFVVISGGRRDNASKALCSRFDELVRIWKYDTTPSSSIHEICLHWAYQSVIGLGPDVVPLIMEEIQKGGRHWGWALAAITGENPAEHTDSLKAAAEAWLRWGEDRQFNVGLARTL